jgi:cell wall-associated NlpC family hydrolase
VTASIAVFSTTLGCAGATPTPVPSAPGGTPTSATSVAPPNAAQAAWSSVTPSQLTVTDAAVSALVTRLSAAQAALTAANQGAELAEQKAAGAQQQLAAAQYSESVAGARAEQAARTLQAALATIKTMALREYMTGTRDSIAIMLTAPDPSELVVAETVHGQLAAAKALVLTTAADSKRSLDAADTAAREANQQARQAAAQASEAQAQALSEQAAAQALTATVSAALVQAQLTAQQDASVLAALSGGYGSPALTAAQLSAYAQQAAAASSQKLAPGATKWTPALGQSAVYRALAELAVPYSFAAGNAKGPTLGVNSGGGGEHDGSVTGFDCSGLTLYAWAPYLSLPHDAATQYSTAGTMHPTPQQLMPGDLVFWSGDGTVAGIHHVALYIGSGDVVQAPESGDVVRITPLNQVDSGIFGSTRPLS